MSLPFLVSSTKTEKVIQIGNEKTPVIIIDDLLVSPDEVKKDAVHNHIFSDTNSGFYPGIRAALPRDYIIETLRATYKTIATVYAIPQPLQLKPLASYYSLISTPPHALATPQQIPHFDSTQPYHFAVLHYINEGPHGGTGFFRDNATQFERISSQRENTYLHSVAHLSKQIAGEPPSYITSSTSHFTLYEQVEYRPNRLVIYPGNLLHSGLINPEKDISNTPHDGRLTANIFINFT
jgi:hypothetical protein